MKKKRMIAVLAVLMLVVCGRIAAAQEEPYPLVVKALEIQKSVMIHLDGPPYAHRRKILDEAEEVMGLDALYSDEFFRQAEVYMEAHGKPPGPGGARSDYAAHMAVSRLLSLLRVLGDERAAPALVSAVEAQTRYSWDAFVILAELDPNNPAIDRLIAESVERALAGPPYRSVPAAWLHLQRADLAIENAERLHQFTISEFERIGKPTVDNQEERFALHRVQSEARRALTFAQRYAWVDFDDVEKVIQQFLDGEYGDNGRRITHHAYPRIHQAMRRRGLVDLYVQEVRRRHPDAELHEVPGRTHIRELAPHLTPEQWRELHAASDSP